MKKTLCFIGIFVLLFLAFLPPALRLFLPDKEAEIIEEETKKINSTKIGMWASPTPSFQKEKIFSCFCRQEAPQASFLERQYKTIATRNSPLKRL